MSGNQVLTAGQVATVAGVGDATHGSARDVLAAIARDLPVVYSGMFGEDFGMGWPDTGLPYITKVT